MAIAVLGLSNDVVLNCVTFTDVFYVVNISCRMW